jgi:pimeloyl-ACP methyl ester carboxylesterase
MKETADLINQYEIPLTIYVGKYDRIITPDAMENLLKYVRKADLKEIESGHNQLIAKVAAIHRQKSI